MTNLNSSSVDIGRELPADIAQKLKTMRESFMLCRNNYQMLCAASETLEKQVERSKSSMRLCYTELELFLKELEEDGYHDPEEFQVPFPEGHSTSEPYPIRSSLCSGALYDNQPNPMVSNKIPDTSWSAQLSSKRTGSVAVSENPTDSAHEKRIPALEEKTSALQSEGTDELLVGDRKSSQTKISQQSWPRSRFGASEDKLGNRKEQGAGRNRIDRSPKPALQSGETPRGYAIRSAYSTPQEEGTTISFLGSFLRSLDSRVKWSMSAVLFVFVYTFVWVVYRR